jgi:hypothetical protein
MALEEDAAQVLGQKVCWLVVRRVVPDRYDFLNNQLTDVVKAQSNMLGSAVTHSTCCKRYSTLVVFEYHSRPMLSRETYSASHEECVMLR